MTKASDSVTLQGTVTRLFHSSPTFCAGRLQPARGQVVGNGEVSFAGKIFVREGEAVTLVGVWEENERFGRQLRVKERLYEAAITKDGLAAWLTHHGDAHGIGPVRARKIAEEFGDTFAEMLRDNPEQIAIAARVPLESVKKLAASWAEHEEENAVGIKLAAYGLTPAQIAAIYEKFKGSTVTLLEADPYMLVGEVAGLGFKRVDEIAKKMGTPPNHPGRLRAALLHVLWEARDDGSTCLEREKLIDSAVEVLILEEDDAEEMISGQLDALLEEGKRLRCVPDGVRSWVALASSYRDEATIADFLLSATSPNPNWAGIDGLDSALEYVGVTCPNLDDSQRRAVAKSLLHRACVITGGAGSGKSTTIAAIANLYRKQGFTVLLCAPTGKAARRLEEVAPGFIATTIHKLLGYNPKMGGFVCHKGNPIRGHVLIADEVSMGDSSLMARLFDAIPPEMAVVLVGDQHQLPPVGAGAFLRDVVTRELMPVAILGQCHRQAGPLKHNASAILLGEVAHSVTAEGEGVSPWMTSRKLYASADVLRSVEKLFTEILEGKFGFDLIKDVQFLTPIHRGPLGTQALNVLLQRLHQARLGVTVEPVAADSRPKLHVGDKVIQTRNNYTLDVMNGHQGVVLQARPLIVQFDDRTVDVPNDCAGDVELAYALTVHKVQGSQFPCVVAICHSSHKFVTHRNWLYTAVTRATKSTIILGDDQGITEAARRLVNNQRRTLLPLLVGQAERVQS